MVKVIKELRINYGLVCQYKADQVELDSQTKQTMILLRVSFCPLYPLAVEKQEEWKMLQNNM